jgi:hypothetical protein
MPLVTSVLCTAIRSSSKMVVGPPVNLVSVNTAPERAAKVIGAVIEAVKDKYNIVHAGNAESELFPRFKGEYRC